MPRNYRKIDERREDREAIDAEAIIRSLSTNQVPRGVAEWAIERIRHTDAPVDFVVYTALTFTRNTELSHTWTLEHAWRYCDGILDNRIERAQLARAL